MGTSTFEQAVYKLHSSKFFASAFFGVLCKRRAGGNTSVEYRIYTFASTTSVVLYSVDSDRICDHIRWSQTVFGTVYGGVGPYLYKHGPKSENRKSV
jgi:hypothetical protein